MLSSLYKKGKGNDASVDGRYNLFYLKDKIILKYY